MSRIGNLAVDIPKGVTVTLSGQSIGVKGPKGELVTPIPEGISCAIEKEEVQFKRVDNERRRRALHGLARALLSNAVTGVSTGWTKTLEIQGIGYRAAVQGKTIEFALGYSHPVVFPIPAGIEIKVDRQTRVLISGADRQQVGQVAADIRGLRPPEPYKGKGIRYADEVIKKKVGKTGA